MRHAAIQGTSGTGAAETGESSRWEEVGSAKDWTVSGARHRGQFHLGRIVCGSQADGAGLNCAMIPGCREASWTGEMYKLWQGKSRGHWEGDC